MSDFFDGLEYDLATEIELLSRLIYELRENRSAVLKSHGVEDEAALLEKIRDGAAAEHPAYEHYLAARIFSDTREAARSLVAEKLRSRGGKA